MREQENPQVIPNYTASWQCILHWFFQKT